MGQLVLDERLAATLPKVGDPPRNPTGYNGTKMQRFRNKDIRKLILEGGDQPCGVEGYENLSLMQYVFSVVIWEMAAQGGKYSRFAMTFIANRVFGPVPLSVQFQQEEESDLRDLTNEQLALRVERLRDLILRPLQRETIDVEATPADRGTNPPEVTYRVAEGDSRKP